MYPPRITIERAKALRRRMTLPEVVLWQALRGRRLGGVRVRRQHPVGPYILDFWCPDARLAIEVDGSGHEDPDQALHDAFRTDWLERRGITVWRVPARSVLGNLDGVLAGLEARVRDQCPTIPPPSGEVARRSFSAVTEGARRGHGLSTSDTRCAAGPLHPRASARRSPSPDGGGMMGEE
ncbi:endonuclease domain-containing protein [Brevundimonas sp. R86498]|uniref:endonuclease domain-containing protein n=1 Tax=Brevundimonas sp. R86498 TaxID=3093845 RepID=UPI0037CA4E4C